MQSDTTQSQAPQQGQQPREHGEGRGRRRRGRRGGSDRHQAAQGEQQAPADTQPTAIETRDDIAADGFEAVVTPSVVQKQAQISEPASFHAHEPEAHVDAPVEEVVREELPVRSEPVQVAEPIQPSEPAQRAEPAQPPVKLDWPSDLVQIETNPEKARAAAEAQAHEPARVCPPRVRPALVPISNEPLVQVETKRRDAPALHA